MSKTNVRTKVVWCVSSDAEAIGRGIQGIVRNVQEMVREMGETSVIVRGGKDSEEAAAMLIAGGMKGEQVMMLREQTTGAGKKIFLFFLVGFLFSSVPFCRAVGLHVCAIGVPKTWLLYHLSLFFLKWGLKHRLVGDARVARREGARLGVDVERRANALGELPRRGVRRGTERRYEPP